MNHTHKKIQHKFINGVYILNFTTFRLKSQLVPLLVLLTIEMKH